MPILMEPVPQVKRRRVDVQGVTVDKFHNLNVNTMYNTSPVEYPHKSPSHSAPVITVSLIKDQPVSDASDMMDDNVASVATKDIPEVNHSDDMVIDEIRPSDCPCGHLHGPDGHHDDYSAIGLTNQPLLRGPD